MSTLHVTALGQSILFTRVTIMTKCNYAITHTCKI